MSQTAIFGPVFATLSLTFLVWVYLYVRRIHFITNNSLSPEQLAVPGALAELSPPGVSNPSDNFKNLFEIPVLFYVLSLYLFVTNQVDAILPRTFGRAAALFQRPRRVRSLGRLYRAADAHRRSCGRAAAHF